jgi:hypothetical protein
MSITFPVTCLSIGALALVLDVSFRGEISKSIKNKIEHLVLLLRCLHVPSHVISATMALPKTARRDHYL